MAFCWISWLRYYLIMWTDETRAGEEEWGLKREGENFLLSWVNFPTSQYIGSSQGRIWWARAAGMCCWGWWEWYIVDCDDLGCQGNMALRAVSFILHPFTCRLLLKGKVQAFLPPLQLCVSFVWREAIVWSQSDLDPLDHWMIRIANAQKIPLFFGQIRKLIWLILCICLMLEQGEGGGPSLSAVACNDIRWSGTWSHTSREADQLKGWSQCV